ncbi:putative zinc-binding protein [Planctomycetota bacterium]
MVRDDKSPMCSPVSTLIFACFGAADVGEISDKVARQLTRDCVGKMFCLSGVGGKVEPIINATKSASKIIAIDGCNLDCVKKCLQQAGFDGFQHLRITDMDMEKGKTPATEENITEAVKKANELLN